MKRDTLKMKLTKSYLKCILITDKITQHLKPSGKFSGLRCMANKIIYPYTKGTSHENIHITDEAFSGELQAS